MNKYWLVLLFAVLIAYTPGFGQSVGATDDGSVLLTDANQKYVIGKSLYYYEDPTTALSLPQVLHPAFEQKFVRSEKDRLNFGFSKSDYWLRLRIKNQSAHSQHWFLEIGYPLLDYLEVYTQKSDGSWQVQKTGDTFPFVQRPVLHRTFVIPLSDSREQTYYFKIRSKGLYNIPMEITAREDFYRESVQSELLYGFFVGTMIIMVLYNLVLFFSLRDLNYLYYVFSICGMLFTFASLSGHVYQYVFPNYPVAASMMLNAAFLTWLMSTSAFALRFLNTDTYAPYFSRLHKLIMAGAAITALLLFFIDYNLILRIAIQGIVFNCLILIASGARCWYRGNRGARYFVFAWTLYLSGTLILVFRSIGYLPINPVTTHIAEFGAMAEVVLLAFALSDRYRLINLEKKEAQENALRIQLEASETLEQKVVQRTEELNLANEELNATLEELNATLTQINLQKLIIEQKNINITSSINYARRIQEAMLPDEVRLQKTLPEHFILFKPRDIVSGDFYWFARKNNKLIIAAVDCTGHGVPGSLMSMVGNGLLSQAVNERGITQANEILAFLQKGVCNTFRQDETDSRDGMDLALCVIDTEKKILEYAGAKNPLYLFQQGQLREIKADKFSIGGAEDEKTATFTLHTIDISQPTTLYLFSDGYQDQFGGPDNKKFMVRQFRELICSIHHLPMDEQRQILDSTIEKWRNYREQVDDILIWGIRI